MSCTFYVACELGAEVGRVMLSTLDKDKLTVSEIRRFQNVPVKEKESLRWDIPRLYQETLTGLREIGDYEEPVDSISCSSWASDYMLFDEAGSLMSPTFHYDDPRAAAGMKEVLSSVSRETIYDETGIQQMPANTLFQLGAEKSRRLSRASRLMPVADGFNYLLAGVPRIEMSQASATQLYNPVAREWSDELLNALRFPAKLLPPVVPAGTKLGDLRADLVTETGLADARVVASCSHEIAAALAGLPIESGERWAYLSAGTWPVMGIELVRPIIHDASREMNFTNELGYDGSVRFSKRLAGIWIFEECRRFWKQQDRDLDPDVLMHLAVSADPFESLINPADPRFLTPEDMPLKIQAFCKETNQPVPRKPGAIIRCVFESLALQYRKTLREIEALTGRDVQRLYVIGDSRNSLMNNFTANALQIPLVIAPPDATAIGNVIVQALALGHIKSLEHAREIMRHSFKTKTIVPHATVWNGAYERFVELTPF